MLASRALKAFWCPAWLPATGADGHRFPVVLGHICHCCADVLCTPRHPKWHQKPMFRQVKGAAGECPAWQSVATDGLRERRKPSGPWFNGVTSLLPVWREGGGKGHMGRCVGEEGRDRCDNQVPCSMSLEDWSFQWLCWCCGRVNILLSLPESCHARAENTGNATSVQGASCLGYIFIVVRGAQLPVPLSLPCRTTGTTNWSLNQPAVTLMPCSSGWTASIENLGVFGKMGVRRVFH